MVSVFIYLVPVLFLVPGTKLLQYVCGVGWYVWRPGGGVGEEQVA